MENARRSTGIRKTSTTEHASTPPTRLYPWYVVFVLMLCNMLASIDTRLPYILVEALKRDLLFSDTQIGLITGPAFSLTYAICAIPIAKLADRRSRTKIIGWAILVWSAFMTCAGLAWGAGSFAFTRVGLAIAESALTPAAHSIIASYLQGAERAKGIAIYSVGIAAGAFVAFALGGYIGDRLGWRITFFIIGGAGAVVAALVMVTIHEPAREAAPQDRSTPSGDFQKLFRHPTLRHLILGGALLGFSSGAINSWGPAYVMRTFHLSATETGMTYGALAGLLAIIGMIAGGFIASWLSERDPRYALQMLTGVFALATVTQVGALLVHDYSLFMALLAVSVFLSSFYIGPTFAAIQSNIDPDARSFASAVTLFCINGIGIASGTFIVGGLSDALTKWTASESLKWALLVTSTVKLWSALHYWLASRHTVLRERSREKAGN